MATRTVFRDRRRAAARRVRELTSKLHLRTAVNRGQAQQAVVRISGQLAGLADRAMSQAQAVLHNAKRAVGKVTGRMGGRLRWCELAILIERAGRIVSQTHRRLAGDMPASATRLVSLHDPDARPIPKGRINRPVEFGYKTQIVDNEHGIVADYTVEQGNPADAAQLAPAVTRVIHRTGKTPAAVAADRGYGDAAVEDELHHLGVKTVAIPRKATQPQPVAGMNADRPSANSSSGAPDPRDASAI